MLRFLGDAAAMLEQYEVEFLVRFLAMPIQYQSGEEEMGA